MSENTIRFETNLVVELDADSDRVEEAERVIGADDESDVWDFIANLYGQKLREIVDEDEFVSVETEWERVGDDDD